MSILRANATYHSVVVKLSTSDDREFYASISERGIEFYDKEISGVLKGKPIVKSADDVFKWIERAGDKKLFGDRKGVQPKKKVTPVISTPKFGVKKK